MNEQGRADEGEGEVLEQDRMGAEEEQRGGVRGGPDAEAGDEGGRDAQRASQADGEARTGQCDGEEGEDEPQRGLARAIDGATCVRSVRSCRRRTSESCCGSATLAMTSGRRSWSYRRISGAIEY